MEVHKMESVNLDDLSPSSLDDDSHEYNRQEQVVQTTNDDSSSIVTTKEGTNPETLADWWAHGVKRLHAPILSCLQTVTQTAVKHPKRTIAAVTCLSLLLLVVGLFTNFTMDVDEDVLWTPANSKPVQHSDWIDDQSGFPVANRDFILFFHANGANVLGQPKESVQHVFDAMNAVRQIPGYDRICAKSTYVDTVTGEPTCEVDGIVNFWSLSVDAFNQQVTLNEDAIRAMSNTTFPDGTPVSENGIFGKPERDSKGILVSALSYSVVVGLPGSNDDDEEKEVEDFEKNALDVIHDLSDALEAMAGNTFRLEVLAERSFGDEFERAIFRDIPLIPIVFVIMSIFTALVFSRKDKVRSRSLLGFAAVVSVLLSLFSGFGLMFIIGVSFTSMTQILPFVIFGVGLDDAFIIYGSYSRTKEENDIADRIRDTITDAGLSITLTTLTSVLAFGLGCLSSIPAVYWLCLYAFPTIILIYLYQLTFFIACIVLDERRIQQNRRDCCICCTVPQHAEDNENSSNGPSQSAPTHNGTFADAFMVRYAEFLMKPVVKVLVILAFVALAVLCAISSTKLTQEFKFSDVMPDDSYVTDFLDTTDGYTSRNTIAPYAYFRFVDQSDPEIQAQMEAYVDELVSIEAIDDQPEFFWLRDFLSFVDNDKTGSLAELDFPQQVDAFLADLVYFDLYSSHIVRDESSGDILASRVKIQMDNVDLEDVNQQIDTLKDQRSVTSRQPINAGQSKWRFFSYDGIYNIWEFYSVSVQELILTTVLGVVAVTAVALLFVPHWTGALFVLPMICLLYIDLLGVMQWAGVHVNAVSYIALVMSIGLLVDFILHVLLRYYESPGSRQEKTVEMLTTMGSSVLIGGISTFLGTLPLAFSTSTIFYTIFIAFVGLVTLGVGHGLILLPVILSLIGPENNNNNKHGAAVNAPAAVGPDNVMATTTRTNSSDV